MRLFARTCAVEALPDILLQKRKFSNRKFPRMEKSYYLLFPYERLIICTADSSTKVNPSKARSKEPKYASRTSGETVTKE